jgi:hypothetical protein
VASDGTNITVKCIDGGSAPSDGTCSGTSPVYSSSAFALQRGRFGFVAESVGYMGESIWVIWLKELRVPLVFGGALGCFTH